MSKLLFSISALFIVGTVLLSAGTASAQTISGTVQIGIMQHLCPVNIQSVSSLNALGSFAQKVNVCPTVVMPMHVSSPDARSGYKYPFNYTITARDGSGNLVSYTTPNFFQQSKVCETVFDLDINGDGRKTSDACLDTSNYVFNNIPAGETSVIESMPIAGTRLGAVEFTPTSLQDNNDRDTLVSTQGNVINLDTDKDDDDIVMLHVFNFINPTGVVSGGTALPTINIASLTEVQRQQLVAILTALVGVLRQMIILQGGAV